MYLKLLFVLIFSITLIRIESAKILAVYPTPSISHQVVFRKITNELVRKGHEVTVITPNPEFSKNKAPANLTEVDVQDVSYNIMRNVFSEESAKDNLNLLTDARLLQMFAGHVFEIQLQVPEVKELLFGNKNPFDVILIEEIMRPALAVSHVFKAPVILISSLGAMCDVLGRFGSETHPLLYPTPMQRRLYDLSLWEKVDSLYNHYKWLYLTSAAEDHTNKMLQKHFGPEIPPLTELHNNAEMLFLNIHPIWANNQPVPPNVVFLGGLHQLESKKLPEDLQHFLDSSKHGVIYVSFGSNALSTFLPLEKIEIIEKVLAQLPYDVLWKWDQDELPGKSKNIKLSKWLPQADLLKHPKIKLFITQAGLQSTDEAITAGVPLVALPVLGDQWFNAEQYMHNGIGKKVLFEEVTHDTIKNAIEIVITDNSYRQNILKLREVMHDQPQKPLDRAIFWIEHVIRHKGGKHLRASGANLTWSQYYELDVLILLLSVILVTVALLGTCLLYIYRSVCTSTIKKQKLKKK